MKRGDIYFADLSPVMGSEQGGVRPVLVIQNDVGNRFSPTVIVACITSQKINKKMPTHVKLDKEKYKLKDESMILMEQIRTVDKDRLEGYKYCTLDYEDMKEAEKALNISLGLIDPSSSNTYKQTQQYKSNNTTFAKREYSLV